MTPERLLSEQYMPRADAYRLFRHEISGIIDIHWHDFFELAFVVSGTGYHLVNGARMPIRRGSAFLLTTADFHAIVPDEGQTLRLFNLIFSDRFVRDELAAIAFERAGPLLHTFEEDEANRVEQEFENIWRENEQKELGCGPMIQGSFERLLVTLVRRCRMDSNQMPVAAQLPSEVDRVLIHPSVRKALLYIHYRFRERLALEDAANYAGLSPHYFSERFRLAIGTTFQHYVQSLRLQFAAALLRSTALPVTEICYASGFQTIGHFERTFKRRYGQPPREWRRHE